MGDNISVIIISHANVYFSYKDIDFNILLNLSLA